MVDMINSVTALITAIAALVGAVAAFVVAWKKGGPRRGVGVRTKKPWVGIGFLLITLAGVIFYARACTGGGGLPDPDWPPCNPGGTEFLFPRNDVLTGVAEIRAVIRAGARCAVREVKFGYDCDWPQSGPRWQYFSSLKAPAGDLRGDVYFNVTLNVDTARDGGGVPVMQASRECQIIGQVVYSGGNVVPNFTGFRVR